MSKRRSEEAAELDDVDRDRDEDPTQFPGDLRPEWVKEDVVDQGRAPNLEEVEEDAVDL